MENSPLPIPPPPASNGSNGLNERQWAVAIHLSAFIGLIIPFGNIIAPLIIWLIKKEQIPSLDSVGRNVLNFQISWAIYFIVAGLSLYICVGAFLLPLLAIAWIVFVIIGAVKTSNGESYTFPLTIKLL